MKELKELFQKMKTGGSLTKTGEVILKVIITVLIIAFLLIFIQIGVFVGIFSWLQGLVRSITGLDAMLAKGIAFVLMALLLGTQLGGLIWSFLPVPQKNQKRKRFIFLTVLGIFFFGAYFASKNVYFDPETGQAVKYYSIDTNGEYKFSSSGGYDPVTGEALKPVTGKVATEYYVEKKQKDSAEKIVNSNDSSSAQTKVLRVIVGVIALITALIVCFAAAVEEGNSTGLFILSIILCLGGIYLVAS